MGYSDPLEETVGADDLTGRNNCPGWMRISRNLSFEQRVIIQNGVRQDHEKSKGRGKGYKAIRCWVEISGIKTPFEQIAHASAVIGIAGTALSKRRNRAIARGECTNVANGFLWGWTF